MIESGFPNHLQMLVKEKHARIRAHIIRQMFISFLFLLFWESCLAQNPIEITTVLDTTFHVSYSVKLETSMKSIVNLLNDTASYTDWLHFCKKAKVIKQVNNSEWIFYFQYDSDNVLFRDRYFIAHVFLKRDPVLNQMSYILKSYVGPERWSNFKIPDDCGIRIEEFHIFWRFTQDKDSIIVENNVLLDPGLKVPDVFVQDYLRTLNRKSIEKFARQIRLKRYLQ